MLSLIYDTAVTSQQIVRKSTVETVIDQLLKENQSVMLRERRSASRQLFIRPVQIFRSLREPENVELGFSRDISEKGIGIITNTNWEKGTIVELEIHSLFNRNVRVAAEARWTEPFGRGWFFTGWYFLHE